MERRTIALMTAWIRGLALPLILLAYLAGGGETAIGGAAGAVLALANWTLIARVARRLLGASDASRVRWMLLLVGKTGVIIALVVFFTRIFDATGLVLGVSTMVVGVLAGAVHAHLRWGGEVAEPAGAPGGE